MDEPILVVTRPIPLDRVSELAEAGFGDLVKAVVDIDQQIMAVGGELHADEEALLLEHGARQADLWGINLYPAEYGGLDWIEYDSMINVRPAQGNRTRGVDDVDVRARIAQIVDRLVVP
ncbi:MAG: DUF5674 family protein [Chloroflexota bacterium]